LARAISPDSFARLAIQKHPQTFVGTLRPTGALSSGYFSMAPSIAEIASRGFPRRFATCAPMKQACTLGSPVVSRAWTRRSHSSPARTFPSDSHDKTAFINSCLILASVRICSVIVNPGCPAPATQVMPTTRPRAQTIRLLFAPISPISKRRTSTVPDLSLSVSYCLSLSKPYPDL